MTQEVVQSKNTDAEQAVNDLCSHLKKPLSSYTAIIFFASSMYDFQKLSELLHEKFQKAEVIGATTAGEITNSGFSKYTVVLNAISDTAASRTQFKGVLIENADKFPVIYKNDIIKAASSIGLQLSSNSISRNAFAITLICGLHNAEESILSLLYNIIKDHDFMIAGGSAGDDLKFKSTYVSYNGRISDTGAVVLFVKTNARFEIYKENIFHISGKSVILTGVNPDAHLVSTIDKKNPRKRYAEILGVPESQVNDAILEHPFGRVFGDEVFIASLERFDNDGKLYMYARVLQDSSQEILEPMDAESICEQTCQNIIQKIPHPECVIFFNCILRTIGFEKKHQQGTISNIWSKHFPVHSGFSTYGEQFGHINSNQTLVVLVMGE